MPSPTDCFRINRTANVDFLGQLRLVTILGVVASMFKTRAKYHLGQVVRHRKHPFRGVVFDVDAMFSNTDAWYEAIPEESRPAKDQPYYHLLAENDQSFYVAYVSEQNLVADYSGEPVEHPDVPEIFGPFEDGLYPLQVQMN
ncbi:heat shock protein HspQ [Loktanella salsilacus]|uniref:Heat shock protein HspQ n=2 Tax=Roseobacteraceae TaxID=2854170 RepID=A0A1I4F5F0_9RHOB|nr:heat shock protein HspQ [Loktanella salsilacus]